MVVAGLPRGAATMGSPNTHELNERIKGNLISHLWTGQVGL